MTSITSALKRIGGQPSLQIYLQGRWLFNRTMIHTDNGSSLGSVNNATAVFSTIDVNTSTSTSTSTTPASDPQLLYREEGNVLFSSTSNPLPFYREYLYTFKSTTSADVSFWRPGNTEEHMKFFHTLQVTEEGVGATSEHLCIDDLYKATIRVASESMFSATWVVDGPNKNYSITTTFTRQDETTEGSNTEGNPKQEGDGGAL